MSDIIVTGSIAYDYLMRFPGKFGDHLLSDQLHQISVSFLVEDMTKHWGGVAANIAYSMALLGLRPKLMGAVGRDFPDYRQWLESAGVDTSTVKQIDDVFTASFFCNTDDENNQIASFYSGAMVYARDFKLTDIHKGKPDLVLISPNDPLAMQNLAQECRDREIPFVYDPSQQIARMTGEDLLRDMEGAHALIVNAYEAEMISQKTNQTINDLREQIDILVITEGRHGSRIYQRDEFIQVEAFPLNEVKDPTGGGDSYRSGFVYGLLKGWPLRLCGEVGSLCAAYTLEQVGTQNHCYSIPEFVERFRTHFDDEGHLDAMLERIGDS